MTPRLILLTGPAADEVARVLRKGTHTARLGWNFPTWDAVREYVSCLIHICYGPGAIQGRKVDLTTKQVEQGICSLPGGEEWLVGLVLPGTRAMSVPALLEGISPVAGEREGKEKVMIYDPMKYEAELEAELAELRRKLGDPKELEAELAELRRKLGDTEEFFARYFAAGSGEVIKKPIPEPLPVELEDLAEPTVPTQREDTLDYRMRRRITRQRREIARLSRRLDAFQRASNIIEAKELYRLARELTEKHDPKLRAEALSALSKIINNVGQKGLPAHINDILAASQVLFAAASDALDKALTVVGDAARSRS